MAKKKKQEDPPKGSPAWMATFSDLMNLLLCFFVLLFSMSSIDAGKYAELVQSLNCSFNSSFNIFANRSGQSIINNTLFPKSVQQIEELEEYESSTGEPVEVEVTEENFDADAYLEELNKEKAEQLYMEVTQLTENEALESTIEVSIDEKYQYVKLSLSGAILFDSGKSEIKEESKKILSKIGDIMKNYEDNLIKIEGHTDNEPITSGKFADNMELSSARAYSVWTYMTQEKYMDPVSLEASGRSEYVPVADNTTAEGRAKNRRVEFKIYTENEKK